MRNTTSERILKIDRIHYVYSKKQVMEGHLWLTKTKLILEAKKDYIGFFELLLHFLRVKKMNTVYGFKLTSGEIKKIEKSLINNNVAISITSNKNKTYTIVLRKDNYKDWQKIINEYL